MIKTIGIDISVLNAKQKTGIAVYAYHLIDALLKINRRDKFILFGIATLDSYQFLKNLPFARYPNVELKIYRMPSRFFRTAFLLWQKFNWPPIESLTGPLDIFHSFNFYLPPQKSGKVVATIFDMTPLLFPNLHMNRTIQLDKVRINRIRDNADLVVAISQNSKKDFLKYTSGKRVEVIYPGIADHFLKKIYEPKAEEVLKKYNLESGYILSVGTLEPRKNIKFLINAFLKSKINRKLVLVGIKGWKNSLLFELMNKFKDKITALGFIPDEDLPYVYSQARCFVYPSLYEGFGLPVLEALALNIPVICSQNSALAEAGGNAVFYIDPACEGGLINALIKVINNEALRRDLIAKGLKQAGKFSWEKSAGRLNFLYQQL